MKRILTFLLCIVLCFYLIPIPLSAEGVLQYAAITQNTHGDEITYGLSTVASVSEAVYYPECSGVVVYSLDEEDPPTPVTDAFDGFEDKMVILSDVSFSGFINCRDLYLLGHAEMITDNMIISGSSDDGTPKPALSLSDLESPEVLMAALEGIGIKCTITSDANINSSESCNILEINPGVTLTISAPPSGNGVNIIEVSNTLIVNGSLIAEEGQILRIQEGCDTVTGLTLYDDDGNTVFDRIGEHMEMFEYHVGEGKWVRQSPGGPPQTNVNDNEFVVSYDDFTPDNGHTPEVKYQIDDGSEIPINRDQIIQFYQNGDSPVASISFSMKPAQFEDGSYETFYRVWIIQANDSEHPVEYGIEDEAVTYDNDTNTYFFTVTPVEKGSDYEGFRVEIFWTEETFNNEPGGGGEEPQNTYAINLDYNTNGGSILVDRFHGDGPRFESPGEQQFFENANVGVYFEPEPGYIIQGAYLDGAPLIDENTQEPVTEYIFENINANHTLSVTFTRLEYTITVTHSEHGQIEVQGGIEGIVDGSAVAYTVQHGDNIRFRFIPDNGYMVSEILADGQTENPWDEYEFNNIRENHTLHVVFDRIGDGSMHTITVSSSDGGTVEAQGLENGIVLIEDMFSLTFTFTPDPGYHLKSVIASEGYGEMDMTYYGVVYNEDGSFSLTLSDVSQNMTLDILFESENAEDITIKKYVVMENNDTPEKIAEALAREFGFITYAVDPAGINVENIDLSGIATVGYGTFDFSVTVGGVLIEDQGFIVPTHEYILFEFYGINDGEPVYEIRMLTPADIEDMIFSVPAMDSGSIRLYGVNGIRFEGVLSSDVHDAFIGGTRNECVVGRAFYRAQWHISNSYDIHDPQSLNLFGLNLIQDNAFCVEVAASSGEDEQRTYNWDLNRYAQLTTGSYTSDVFYGNNIFTLRPPTNGIGGVESLVIETGVFPGYTVTSDENNQYTLTFLSDFYDNITLTLLINGSVERELTIHRVGVDIQEVEKRPDSDYANVFHGTQNGTHITFNGQNNYQLFATYYIPDFGDTAPFGLYVTYTWANGTTTTQIITQTEITGNINTGSDFDGVFRDDGHNNYVSCCDYRLYTGPDNNEAPVRINVIVLRDNPLATDAFSGVYFGSGKGVEWSREQ